MSDIFRGYGIRIGDLSRENFLRVRETLTRVGTSPEDGVIEQNCFILHKKSHYAILHYKELLAMDGAADDSMTIDDIALRNTTAFLLARWNLITVDDPDEIESPRCPVGKIIIVPFQKKKSYRLVPMYQIGKPKLTGPQLLLG